MIKELGDENERVKNDTRYWRPWPGHKTRYEFKRPQHYWRNESPFLAITYYSSSKSKTKEKDSLYLHQESFDPNLLISWKFLPVFMGPFVESQTSIVVEVIHSALSLYEVRWFPWRRKKIRFVFVQSPAVGEARGEKEEGRGRGVVA